MTFWLYWNFWLFEIFWLFCEFTIFRDFLKSPTTIIDYRLQSPNTNNRLQYYIVVGDLWILKFLRFFKSLTFVIDYLKFLKSTITDYDPRLPTSITDHRSPTTITAPITNYDQRLQSTITNYYHRSPTTITDHRLQPPITKYNNRSPTTITDHRLQILWIYAQLGYRIQSPNHRIHLMNNNSYVWRVCYEVCCMDLYSLCSTWQRTGYKFKYIKIRFTSNLTVFQLLGGKFISWAWI